MFAPSCQALQSSTVHAHESFNKRCMLHLVLHMVYTTNDILRVETLWLNVQGPPYHDAGGWSPSGGFSMGLPPRRLIVGRFVIGAAGAARFSPTLCCCSPSAFLLAAGSGCDAAPSSSAAGAAVSGAAGAGDGGLRNAKAMNSEEAVVSDGSQSLNAGWKCLHGFPASACKQQKHRPFDWSCEV